MAAGQVQRIFGVLEAYPARDFSCSFSSLGHFGGGVNCHGFTSLCLSSSANPQDCRIQEKALKLGATAVLLLSVTDIYPVDTDVMALLAARAPRCPLPAAGCGARL